MPSLDELISQSRFRSEQHKSLISIIYANNIINNNFDRIFKKYDLTLQQFNTLRILRGQYPKPCTINLIKERMLDKMSDASRIVERLRKAGLVERVTSKKDRRAVDVVINKKGLSLLAKLDAVADDLEQPTHKLTQQEAKQLNTLLEKIFDSVNG